MSLEQELITPIYKVGFVLFSSSLTPFLLQEFTFYLHVCSFYLFKYTVVQHDVHVILTEIARMSLEQELLSTPVFSEVLQFFVQCSVDHCLSLHSFFTTDIVLSVLLFTFLITLLVSSNFPFISPLSLHCSNNL